MPVFRVDARDAVVEEVDLFLIHGVAPAVRDVPSAAFPLHDARPDLALRVKLTMVKAQAVLPPNHLEAESKRNSGLGW